MCMFSASYLVFLVTYSTCKQGDQRHRDATDEKTQRQQPSDVEQDLVLQGLHGDVVDVVNRGCFQPRGRIPPQILLKEERVPEQESDEHAARVQEVVDERHEPVHEVQYDEEGDGDQGLRSVAVGFPVGDDR